jgi:HlyD family secretion protein
MNRVKNLFKKPFIWFKHTSWKKRIIALVVICILIFFITAPLRTQGTSYTTDVVKRETVTDIVSESGNVATSGETDISSISTGVIENLYVSNGDSVTAGQKLFTVKATASPQDQASAYYNYQNAVSNENTTEENKLGNQSQLEQDRQAVITASSNVTIEQNNGGLNGTNPTTKTNYTQNDIDALNSALTSAHETFTKDEKKYNDSDAAIAAATADVNSTWLSYQATQTSTVTAPVSGVIENLSNSVGDKITANSNSSATSTSSSNSTSSSTSNSSSSTTSTPVLYIVSSTNNGEPLITVQLNEVDIPVVKIGQTATVTLPAVKDRTFHGKIVRIDKIGTDTSGVITFNAYLSLTDANQEVAPNMTANVDIVTTQHKNALTVSNSALVPYKGGHAVQVLDEKQPGTNKIKLVPVTIGIQGLDRTEILSGVSEGTVVVTGTNTSTSSSTTGGGGGN